MKRSKNEDKGKGKRTTKDISSVVNQEPESCIKVRRSHFCCIIYSKQFPFFLIVNLCLNFHADKEGRRVRLIIKLDKSRKSLSPGFCHPSLPVQLWRLTLNDDEPIIKSTWTLRNFLSYSFPAV